MEEEESGEDEEIGPEWRGEDERPILDGGDGGGEDFAGGGGSGGSDPGVSGGGIGAGEEDDLVVEAECRSGSGGGLFAGEDQGIEGEMGEWGAEVDAHASGGVDGDAEVGADLEVGAEVEGDIIWGEAEPEHYGLEGESGDDLAAVAEDERDGIGLGGDGGEIGEADGGGEAKIFGGLIFDDGEFWDEGEVAVDLADGGDFLEWGDDGGIFWEAEFGTEEDFGGSEDEVAEDIFVLGELALLGIGEAEATPIEDDIGGEDGGFGGESGLKEEGKFEGSPRPRMIGERGGIDGNEGEGCGFGV